MAENTYTDEDGEYNDSMERIVQLYNSMNLNWLVDITGVDDILYNYVRFDFHSVCNDCLEEYASEAYDEYLEGYVERATFCGVLITGFIFNVISGILLYNNLIQVFNSKRFFTKATGTAIRRISEIDGAR